MNKHNLKNVQIFSLFTLTKIVTSVRIKKKMNKKPRISSANEKNYAKFISISLWLYHKYQNK